MFSMLARDGDGIVNIGMSGGVVVNSGKSDGGCSGW